MAAIDWQRGLLLLRQMGSESLEANSMVSVALVDAMARDAQWRKALQCLGQSLGQSLGTELSPVLYNAVLNACAAGRQWQVALNLLEEMRAVALLALLLRHQGTKELDVDAVSVRTAMSAYLGT